MNVSSLLRRLAMVAGVLLLPVAAQAAEVTVKMAFTASGDHMFVHMSKIMEKELEKRVPGKVDWQLFEGGQLGGDGTTMKGLRQGTHIMTMNGSWFQNIEPGFGIFDAPFLFTNRDDVRKVIRAVEDDLATAITKKGIILVGIGELGFRQISNNVRPIVKPSDLNGVKLRTPGNPFRIATFKRFGANPSPMSAHELYMALRQGVVDGQENPLASIWGFKWHEVQNFISMSNHVFTPTFVGVSKAHWDKWPADVQKAMREATAVATEFSFEHGTKKDKSLKAEMLKVNPKLKFNDIDTAAFKKMAEPLYADIENKVGKEIWTKVKAILN